MPRPRKNRQASSSSSGSAALSAGQASYVIDRLISERRISLSDIQRYVADLGREITDLESRLKRLRDAAGGTVVTAGAALAGAAVAAAIVRRGRKPGRPGRPARRGRPAGTGRGPGRPRKAAATTGDAVGNGGPSAATATTARGGAKRGRRSGAALSAGQLASRQLQGRYLALVRQFPEGRRAQFAKTAKEKGREVAIREMQDALKK